MRLALLAILPLFALSSCDETPDQGGGGGGGGGGGAHGKSKGEIAKQNLARAQHRSQQAHKH